MDHGLDRGGKTCVAVVHFSLMFRDLLARHLADESELRVVGTAGSAEEAKTVLAETPPDIALISLSLADGSGIELARELSEDLPDTSVVFLASHFSTENLALAVSVGARGYLFDSCSFDDLLNALKDVADGGYAFDTGILVNTLRENIQHLSLPHQTQFQDSLTHLSPREQEILVLVSKGMTNKEIAQAAYVSVNTVKTHLRRIFQELGVSSRREISRGHFAGVH